MREEGNRDPTTMTRRSPTSCVGKQAARRGLSRPGVSVSQRCRCPPLLVINQISWPEPACRTWCKAIGAGPGVMRLFAAQWFWEAWRLDAAICRGPAPPGHLDAAPDFLALHSHSKNSSGCTILFFSNLGKQK